MNSEPVLGTTHIWAKGENALRFELYNLLVVTLELYPLSNL